MTIEMDIMLDSVVPSESLLANTQTVVRAIKEFRDLTFRFPRGYFYPVKLRNGGNLLLLEVKDDGTCSIGMSVGQRKQSGDIITHWKEEKLQPGDGYPFILPGSVEGTLSMGIIRCVEGPNPEQFEQICYRPRQTA